MASTKQKQAEARAARRNSAQPNPYSNMNVVTISLYGDTLNRFEIFAGVQYNTDKFAADLADLTQQLPPLRNIEEEVRERAARGQNANAARLFLVSHFIADLYANDWKSFMFNGQPGDVTMRKVMTGMLLGHAISHITDQACDVIINMPVEKADEPFGNGDEYIAMPGPGMFVMLRDKNLRLLAHHGYTDETDYAEMTYAKDNPNMVN